jgi:D-threo-aldose 1-dehydrogenase
VHDTAQDTHGDSWLAQLETARTGAFRALARLRDEGVIKGWGLGVNLTEPVDATDIFLFICNVLSCERILR